ncbi:MAG TPA: glycosyltransferase [Mucilaginibacter sp.]|jgi:glycosyltransferase involved in cell wall biosynthesis
MKLNCGGYNNMIAENEPLVSVIIAFLNEQVFLEEAINSILGQSYKNWELILVDDGSIDGSTGIASSYKSKFPKKIILCEHEGHANKGLSASRNLGVQKARGTLIAFLDADDTWLADKLLNQVSIFQQNPEISMIAEASSYWYSWDNPERKNFKIPVGVITDKVRNWHDWDNPAKKNAKIPARITLNKVYNPPHLMLKLYPLGKGAAPCPSSLILKKAAIEAAGKFEESFIKEFSMYEDQAFLSKIYLEHKVYVSSQCNTMYRQRPESIVRTVRKSGKYDKVRKHFLRWLEAYIIKKQVKNKDLSALLNKALFPYDHPALYLVKNKIPNDILNFYRKYAIKIRRRLPKITIFQ